MQHSSGSCGSRRSDGVTVRALVASCVVLALVACEADREVYSMRGQLWVEADACLGPSGVMDVVEGPPPEACEGVRCLRSVENDDLFVTAHCGAPPGWEEVEGDDDPACAGALAAKALGEDGLCK